MTDDPRNPGQGVPPEAHPDSHREPSEPGHHEVESLWAVFRERAIHLPSLNGSLRLIVGFAIAQIVVSAAMIAGRDYLHPLIPVFAGPDSLIEMPVWVFAISVVFLVVAWAYILAGVFHANRILQLIVLAAFTFVVQFANIEHHWWATAGHYGLLGAIWLLAIALAAHDRFRARERGHSHRHHFRSPTFLVLLVLIAAYYAVGWLDTNDGLLLAYTTGVSIQLEALQFALVPILFLAGTDFAEWGEVAASRIVNLVGRARRPALLPVLAGVSAVAVLGGLAAQKLPLKVLAAQAGAGLLALLLVAVVVVAVRLPKSIPAAVPFAALAAGAGLFFGGLLVPAVALSLPSYQAASKDTHAETGGFILIRYHHETEPKFSIEYPQLWDIQKLSDGGPNQPTLIVFSGIKHVSDPAVMEVIRVNGVSADTPLDAVFKQWLDGCCAKGYTIVEEQPHKDGPWLAEGFSLTSTDAPHTKLRGDLYGQRKGDVVWLLQAQTTDSLYDFHAKAYTKMVESFSAEELSGAPAGAAKPESSSSASIPIWLVSGYWAVIAVLGIFGLALLARRPGRLGVTSLFLVVAGIFIALETVGPGISLLTHGRVPWWPNLRIQGTQAAAALVTLAALAWIALRRRHLARAGHLMGLLFILNAGLQVCSWVADLFGTAADASGRFTIVQALVILAAMAWDITMSGDQITNHGGKHFPRHARVLLFFGYVMLVSSAVLYFSSLHSQSTGAKLAAQFESETWPQSGVLLLGVPLLVAMFVTGVRHWWGGGPGSPALTAPSPETGPDLPPAIDAGPSPAPA